MKRIPKTTKSYSNLVKILDISYIQYSLYKTVQHDEAFIFCAGQKSITEPSSVNSAFSYLLRLRRNTSGSSK